ncbi:hypothetical protein ACFLTD_02575 [Elusimicrobiota bacterium]
MKSKICFFVLFLSLAVSCGLYAEIKFAPYYNYQFIEGLSISPEGDMGFMINLSNDLGLIMKPFKAHSFIGFYSVKYQGPGLKKLEGQEFTERYLDHLFVGRHHWTPGSGITVKSQIDFILESRRSGTNETWENGLYNFNRYGGSSSLMKNIKGIDVAGTFAYHFMTFPNYTDMLAELRSGADASASEGKQNHHIFELGAKGVYKNNEAKINMTLQLYTKQEVAVDDVQSDGSYYSSDKQKDFTLSIDASRKELLSEVSVIEPGLSFVCKNSNQNYQHFTEVTSTSPVSFHSNYNNYVDVTVDSPLTVSLSKKWSFMFIPELSYKKYLSREARDEEGAFTDKKQSRLLGIYTVAFKNQIGESSSSMLFLTVQNQKSNMEFERYVTYNYTGYSFGLKFQMEY